MLNDVTGKVALVTGGSSGVGKEIARRLAEEGATVVITARGEAGLKATRQDFEREGLAVYAYICDVGEEEQVSFLTDQVYQRFGKIDYLINNAGVGYKANVENTSTELFDAMMNTNVKGVFLMTKHVLPYMKQQKSGYIVNISSGAGRNGIAGLSGYCATKFAVRGFSEAVALEAKPYDVKVSVLLPGSINTEFHANLGVSLTDEDKAEMMQPEDIADTVYYMITQPKRYWVFEVVTRAFLRGRKKKYQSQSSHSQSHGSHSHGHSHGHSGHSGHSSHYHKK